MILRDSTILFSIYEFCIRLRDLKETLGDAVAGP
jgi:hypothetical protein